MKKIHWFKKAVRRMSTVFVTAALLMFSMFLPQQPEAAGLLVADGGFGGALEIVEHDVKVTINNGIAVTDVTQVFLNKENRQVEALYTFPVPKGASVANFSMWINGKEMIGEVVEKKRAREIYESYKQTRKDPGLLEQVDYKTFEMRIFPINAGAQQRVQITYYQELNIDNDQGVYVYPLATVTRKDLDSKTTGKFAINLEVKSAIPIKNLTSPSHGDAFVVSTQSDTYRVASLESTGGSLASDVVVNYELSRPKSGIDMIASSQPGDDGYFCMTITAGEELAQKETGMDYVFVLDVSGSMATDGKLIVSKNALDAFIEAINDKDRFEVIAFNVSPNILFGELRPGSDANRKEAADFMATQKARGGTELVPAMTTAYKYCEPDRVLNVVILSDGMSEQKERQTLLQMIQSRPENARVFCIGIGNEVNRPLLEQMADDSGGLAAFISGSDDFKRAATSFKRKLMRPVASDLKIDFGGLRVYDLEPAVLPNLYHGSPVRLYGRYSGSGEAGITLTGTIQGVEMKQSVVMPFPEKDPDNPEIERMWAWKRVDQLLKKADRAGDREQVLDDIIRLGEDYSIVTPYTSFLVLENDAEYQRWQIERRNTLRIEKDRQAKTRRQEQLELIKRKAVADIGPQAASKAVESGRNSNPGQKPADLSPSANPQSPEPADSPAGKNRQSTDFNFGGGPVGPLFVGIALWLRRKKIRKMMNDE